MLFDEPTSALDPELTGEVLRVIRDLAIGGRTAIIVTHELRFAREVASHVVFMEDGGIVEEGPPEQVLGDAARAADPDLRQQHLRVRFASRQRRLTTAPSATNLPVSAVVVPKSAGSAGHLRWRGRW